MRMSGARERFYPTEFETAVMGLKGDVLEVGCGGQACIPDDIRHTRIVAVDLSSHRLEVARRVTSPRNRHFVACDGAALPFRTSSFDGVAIAFALCSVTEVEGVLNEVARVAKPGSLFVAIEHIRSSLSAFGIIEDIVSPGYAAFCNGCHLNRSPRDHIQASGFEIVKERQTAHMIPWQVTVGRRTSEQRGNRD